MAARRPMASGNSRIFVALAQLSASESETAGQSTSWEAECEMGLPMNHQDHWSKPLVLTPRTGLGR